MAEQQKPKGGLLERRREKQREKKGERADRAANRRKDAAAARSRDPGDHIPPESGSSI